MTEIIRRNARSDDIQRVAYTDREAETGMYSL